jgi:hypothetical protein
MIAPPAVAALRQRQAPLERRDERPPAAARGTALFRFLQIIN